MLLENGVECLPSLPDQTTAVIIDAMAMLQTVVRVPDRFCELAEMVMSRILTEAGEAARIDFVGDQYPAISIKNTERNKRSRDGELVVNVTNGQQLCPRQWRKFLANGKNKTNLLSFLVWEWSENAVYAQKIKDRTFFVTHGDNCTKLVAPNGSTTASDVPELCTNQEEADTRMFLHAEHASQNGHQRIAIKSSDTDVEVLACYYQAVISADIILISGTSRRSRIVSIRRVGERLGREICEILPSLHAITGCDSVSAFSTKGKKKALDVVPMNSALRQTLGSLGERVPARQDDLNKLERFVCALYNDHLCQSVNEHRYKLFCKSKSLQSHQLPPTKEALENHLKRANYQSFIWKHALQTEVNQSPDGQGWQQKNGQLEIYWTNQAPAPQAVMELAAAKDRAKQDAVLVSAMAFSARRHAHAKITALTVVARTIAKMMIAMMILTVTNMKANLGFLFPVSRPRKQRMLFATHWFRTHCIENVINHVHYYFHTVYLINDENKIC